MTDNPLFWHNLYYCIVLFSPPTLTDNKDGTITLIAAHSFDGTRNAKYILKKCLQGQVYQSFTNDCYGTGNSDNQFGAIAYQYCNTNDISCNIEYIKAYNQSTQETTQTKSVDYSLTEDGNSEAYKSCKSQGMWIAF
ncbi:MAG: hypothetical protein H7A23_27125 [Leptospiraceae bacterium]|nr:hypothetical protein [Leptospiraceae bacterium]